MHCEVVFNESETGYVICEAECQSLHRLCGVDCIQCKGYGSWKVDLQCVKSTDMCTYGGVGGTVQNQFTLFEVDYSVCIRSTV